MTETNKAQILLDTWDITIFNAIKDNEGITIGEIREKTGLTHANLIPHIKRLKSIGMIIPERDQQTIHMRTNPDLKQYFPFMDIIKLNKLKSEIKKIRRNSK